MPSLTLLIRSHSRTIHTRPVTFICAKCNNMTTRECYPGTPPKYCLKCRRKKTKDQATQRMERGMFEVTHYLIGLDGKKIEVCLEKSPASGWFWVRSALDWFSGESIIRYHEQKGIYSNDVPLKSYYLEPISDNVTRTPADADNVRLKKVLKPTPDVITASKRFYSGREICRRFKCGDRLLTKMRTSTDFQNWSQERDPEGVAWQYREDKYYPLI